MKNLVFGILFFVGILPTFAASEKPYQFGVFPYLSPVRMNKIYSPVGQQLTKSLSHPVQFRTSSTHKRFLSRLKNEYYDFALIQPFWYPVAIDQHNYKPAVRMQEPFESLIMVLDNSPYQSLNDIKNTIIATPPPFVPVVHMARQALIENNLEPGKDLTFAHFNSVDSCLQQVLIGKASGCVAPPFAPAVFEKDMKVRLRVLFRSKSIPSLSLVIHQRVAVKQRQRIINTFLNWQSEPNNMKLLENMQTKGFKRIDDNEYDVVRDFLKTLKK